MCEHDLTTTENTHKTLIKHIRNMHSMPFLTPAQKDHGLKECFPLLIINYLGYVGFILSSDLIWTARLISAFVFPYIDSTIPPLPKSEITSSKSPEDRFSHDAAQFIF